MKTQKRHIKDRIRWSEFKKSFTKQGIKNFIKSPRVAAPILAYLILLGPLIYLYSGSPPETEVQVYKGFWCPVVYPNHLSEMKDMGANTVFFSAGGLDPWVDFPLEITVANIQTAHRNGLKVALTTVSSGPHWEIDTEALNSRIVEAAKLAERYGVELFVPLDEPEFLLEENTGRWAQEILTRIREVYHGEVIWRGGELVDMDFSGYDYIGLTLDPLSSGGTLEEYSQFVDSKLDEALAFAERDNVKGVMITKFCCEGAGYSEEEIARAYEIVLERGENKVVGFFAMESSQRKPWAISGKTVEVIRRWYKEIL